MNDTRYFIYNHQAAFLRCRLSGMEIADDRVVIERTGVLITPLMDSTERGNVWQRVTASIDLPEGASVEWRFYATDNERVAEKIQGLLEDKALEVRDVLDRLGEYEVSRKTDALDFLPSKLRGQYCAVSLTLTKPEGTTTLVIRTIQVYSAWESFLPYLPEIYREEGGFLDRFLRLFSAPYLELEQKTDALYETLDPRAASPSMVRWLAETMGIPHADLWKTENLRGLLISGLYRKKGRFSALADFVEQYTGFRPYVCENFRMLTGDTENDRHYQNGEITLLLPPEASETELSVESLHTVLTTFLPSGVSYTARILDMHPALSDSSYLGINTRLGEYTAAELGVNSRLNFALLGDSHYGEQKPFSSYPQ